MTVNSQLQLSLNPAVYSCTAYSCRVFQQSHNLEYVAPMIFVCSQGYMVMNDSWYLIFDRYKQEILWRKGHLVIFASRPRRDHTWITRSSSSPNVWSAWLFPMKQRSKPWFCFVLIDQTYQFWHKRCSLPPCGPCLATSNISPNNKVNTRYNGQCSEKESFNTSSRQIRWIDKGIPTTRSWWK